MLTKRAHVLFDENIWKKLVKLAAARHTSVGQIIRDTVSEKYEKEMELQSRKQMLENIEKLRPQPVKGKIDYKSLINYGRKP